MKQAGAAVEVPALPPEGFQLREGIEDLSQGPPVECSVAGKPYGELLDDRAGREGIRQPRHSRVPAVCKNERAAFESFPLGPLVECPIHVFIAGLHCTPPLFG
jgi:hypothetical protein